MSEPIASLEATPPVSEVVNAMHTTATSSVDVDVAPSATNPATVTQPPIAASLDSESLQTAQQPISKKALKKAAKAERFAAQKLIKRAKQKAAKKEKRAERALKRAAGELVDDDEDGLRDNCPDASGRGRRKRRRLGSGFGARVVVDLGFDDKMSDKEINSLCSQLAYTYSANRRASKPFSSLLFTSLNGRTLARLESQADASYKRWTGTTWWGEGYKRLWEACSSGTNAAEGEREADKTLQTCHKYQVVYLTADSSDELEELKEGETYIIGGICDHNRYKNLCLEKAEESGIRSARLPIGKYLSRMATRKVLTVNQVFDILLRWVDTRDWEKALYAVVPKRKLQGVGGEKRSVDEDAGDGDCVADDGVAEVEEGASDSDHSDSDIIADD